MTATLYGYPGSGSAAVEWALGRAGVPHRMVAAASWDDASAMDALRAVNPLGQIPTLVLDDGTVLTESAAILMALGLRHPTSELLPKDPAMRDVALRGLVYIAANCYSAIGTIDHPERWLPSAKKAGREALRAGARALLHQRWAQYADQFTERPRTDSRPDALDVMAATVSRWSGTRPYLKAERPAFYAQLTATERDPEVAAVWARHWP